MRNDGYLFAKISEYAVGLPPIDCRNVVCCCWRAMQPGEAGSTQTERAKGFEKLGFSEPPIPDDV
jgi:hypothetical protein